MYLLQWLLRGKSTTLESSDEGIDELERDVKKIRLAEDLVDLKDPTSTYAGRLESARQRFRAEARGPVQVNFTIRDSLLSFKNQTYV